MDPASLAIFGAMSGFSVGGYALLLRRLASPGGRVGTAMYDLPELAFAFVLAGGFAGMAWLAFHAPPPHIEAISTRQIWVGEAFQMVIAAGVAGFFALRKIPLGQTMGLRHRSALRVAVYALGMLILALPIVMMAALLSTHLPKDVSEEQIIVTLFRSEVRHRDYGGVATILITAAVIAPALEEFLFRGFFYGVFKRYAGPWVSALVTAALFALLHGSLAALGGLFLLALALTAAYECTGSLWVPIGMHALFNSLNLLLLLSASW